MKKHLLSTVLFCFSMALFAQETDSTKSDYKNGFIKENIIYVNVTNPLLSGKAGIAFSMRRKAMDYFLYSNYIYGQGLIKNTLYFSEGEYGIPSKDQNYGYLSGFDFGVQFRFRNSILNKPYYHLIANAKKYTTFYSGFSTEITYVHVEDRIFNSSQQIGSDAWMWNPKFGILFGWTFNKERLFFDINVNLMLGWSQLKIYNAPMGYSWNENYSSFEANPMIFKYQIGFLVGYNL